MAARINFVDAGCDQTASPVSSETIPLDSAPSVKPAIEPCMVASSSSSLSLVPPPALPREVYAIHRAFGLNLRPR